MSVGGMKLKFLAEIVAGQSPASEDVSGLLDGKPFLQGNAEFGSETPSPKLQCDSATKSARPGDVLLSVRAPVGALNLADRAYGIGRGLCAVRPRTRNSRFYFWWLHTRKGELDSLATGSTFFAVTAGTVGNLTVEVVDSDEQRAIASFLDHETAEIDAFIADQQELIGLLRERRAATITQAVTKGLDPNVRMKDSGVEWLGEVPAAWPVMQIKHVTPVKRGASPRPIDDPKYFDDDGEWAWVRIADVSASDGVLRNTKQRLSAIGSSLSVKLERGSLFVSIAGTVGKPCINEIKACIHDGFVYFPGLPEYFRRYLFRIFETGQCYKGLGKLGTQLNLNTDTIGSIKIPVPAPSVIVRVLDYIQDRTAEIDAAIVDAKEAIELSKERRAALISAAVTGKIDVRDHPAAKGAA